MALKHIYMEMTFLNSKRCVHLTERMKKDNITLQVEQDTSFGEPGATVNYSEMSCSSPFSCLKSPKHNENFRSQLNPK